MTRAVALRLEQVRLDGDTQPRVECDRDRAEELAGLLALGVELPPPVVYKDAQGAYWLASGFHRVHAHRLAGRPLAVCEVRDGTLEDARLFAASTNKVSVLPRTTADKMRAVHLVLSNPLAAGWDDARIAAHCQVPEAMVAAQRAAPWAPSPDLFGELEAQPPVTTSARLATGGTIRAEDKGRLSDQDRALIRAQIKRLINKYLRKATLIDADPVELIREALAGPQG